MRDWEIIVVSICAAIPVLIIWILWLFRENGGLMEWLRDRE